MSSEATSRQQFSRGANRFTDFDRSSNSKYNREFMRSFFENARRTEQSSVSRRKGVKNLTSNGGNVERPDSSKPLKCDRETQKTERQSSSSPSTSGPNSRSALVTVRRCESNSVDFTAVKEPLLIERAGKAVLLLPEPSTRIRSKENLKTSEKVLGNKKSKAEVKKVKDFKAVAKEKKSRRKREKQHVDVDHRLGWLHSYQPLFTSSAELLFPLPLVHIGEEENDQKIWGNPKSIPELPIPVAKEPANDEDIPDEDDDDLAPKLVVSVGKSLNCTFAPSSFKKASCLTSSEDQASFFPF